jgi:outer membrane protein
MQAWGQFGLSCGEFDRFGDISVTKTTLCRFRVCSLAALALTISGTSLAQLSGDVGLAAYSTGSIVRGEQRWSSVLPYGYFGYDRFFMRVDTVGAKVLPLGKGHLELVGRLSFEGFKPNAQLPGLRERSNPLPLGLGTFQSFDWGGLFLYAFYNLQGSHGALIEATYAGKVKAGAVTFYPTLSLEHRTAGYVRGLYGTDAAEAASMGKAAYSPGASTVPVLGLSASIPLTGNWGVNIQYRHRWLDSPIRNSPLVDKTNQNSAYVALAYTFK